MNADHQKAIEFLSRLQLALKLRHADLEIKRRARIDQESQRRRIQIRAMGAIPIQAEVIDVTKLPAIQSPS